MTATSRRRAMAWMTPRWRDPGWYAFVLNRLTGLILVAYLLAHFVVLSRLASGPDGWDDLLGLFGSRPFLVGDVLLAAAVIFHGLNGLRVIMLTLGRGTERSGLLFGVVLVASVAIGALAAWGILLA